MFGGPSSERMLILAPLGRDAEIAAEVLTEGGQASLICRDSSEMQGELNKGAASALISQEGMTWSDIEILGDWVASQPPWSDFPFIVLTYKEDSPDRIQMAGEFREKLGNVSFLERPFHATTLVSVCHAALRSRRKQYQARDVLGRYELLARELQHRSKNLLTVVKSIAHSTITDHPSKADFMARLQAIAVAQDLILEGDIRGAPLRDVVASAVKGFGSRVSLDGPHVFLKPSVAQGFALILHELAPPATDRFLSATPGVSPHRGLPCVYERKPKSSQFSQRLCASVDHPVVDGRISTSLFGGGDGEKCTVLSSYENPSGAKSKTGRVPLFATACSSNTLPNPA